MEMGSKCAFIPPDERPANGCLPRLKDPAQATSRCVADEDAVYEQSIEVDLAKLTPMIACPRQLRTRKPIAARWRHSHRSGVSRLLRELGSTGTSVVAADILKRTQDRSLVCD